MRLLVTSEADPASVKIRTALVGMAGWREVGSLTGLPVLAREDWALLTLREDHLYVDGLDRLNAVVWAGGAPPQGWGKPEAVVYASRHRSAAGRRALTVHAIGNFGKADFGGQSGKLPPSAPALQTALLRRLRIEAEGLPLDVTFECTHHGPWLETPVCYVEVGSDESGWQDADAAAAVARAILAARPEPRPVAVGFGGGHYVPRFTDLAVKGRYDFGHMAASWALEAVGPKAVDLALAATAGASHAVFHARSADREAMAAVMDRARALGLTLDSAD